MAPIVATHENDVSVKTKEWNCLDHILWFNVFWITGLHIAGGYGLYLCFTDAKLSTIVFGSVLYQLTMFGLVAGNHRLWSHRSYKAVLPFRIFLAICHTMTYGISIYDWVREHRAHHKYIETDADPHNFRRGFFFAHYGWLMCKKHPDIKEMGKKIDISDLLADPVVVIQKRYYIPSVILLGVIMPTVVPWYFWGESLRNAYFVAVVLRYMIEMNSVASLNSIAHCSFFGYRSYDENQNAIDNPLCSVIVMGEGYHNYHHVFPWDYSCSEWGWYMNLPTLVLDTMAKTGVVYDRKFVTKDMIEKRKSRTGLQSKQCDYFIHEHDY